MANKNYDLAMRYAAEFIGSAYSVAHDSAEEAMRQSRLDKVFESLGEGIKMPISNDEDARLILLRAANKAIDIMGGNYDDVKRARNIGIGVNETEVHIIYQDIERTIVMSHDGAVEFGNDLIKAVKDAKKLINKPKEPFSDN